MIERLVIGALLAALVVLRSSSAAAQERDDEAHGLYMAGAAAYDAGNYEDALGYFQRSYELSHRPALLYNIGQAADRARHDEVALDAFRRYLASEATIEHRDQIEARIRALEIAVARGERSTEPPDDPSSTVPPTDVPPTDVPPSDRPMGDEPTGTDGGNAAEAPGIALVAVGGALAVGGVVLLAMGIPDTGALGDPRMGETYAQAQGRSDLGSGLVGGGIASLGVGLLVAVTGVVLLSAGGGPSRDAAVRLTPHGFALSF